MADSLSDFAAIYLKQGRYAEARPLYERSLEIGERDLGPRHSAVADALYGLAHVHLAQRRPDEAEQIF